MPIEARPPFKGPGLVILFGWHGLLIAAERGREVH